MYIVGGGASKRQQLEMSKGKESIDEKRSNIDERVACLVGSAMKASQLLSPRHCNTLQRTAPHCNVPHRIATHCNSAVKASQLLSPRHCNTLQHTATYRTTLQRTATTP